MKRRFALPGLALALALAASPPAAGAAPARCEKPLTELFQEVSPSVVFISAVGIDPFKLKDRVISGIGSGFVIDKKGLVLTNSHVVYNRGVITVTTDDGQTVPAKLLGADPILDLAVLQVPVSPEGLPEMRLADSSALRVGEEVVAIGNPLGLEQTMTRGIVSGLNRILPETPMSRLLPFIQTDAAINPGNSGGPLVNRCGEVVGINTAGFLGAQSVGFAVPIDIAKRAIPQLVERGRIVRPWIGINGKLVGKELRALLKVPLVDGFLIETLEPGSPGQKAGLRGGTFPIRIGPEELLLGGDIITKVNGRALDAPEALAGTVGSLKVGDAVRLEYFREGKTQEVTITLPERPILPGDLPPEERSSLLPLRGRAPLLPLVP